MHGLPRIALATLLLTAAEAHAGQATCSNPGMPIGATASADLVPERVIVGVTTGLLPISGTELLAEPTGNVLYESTLAIVETRLAAEYTVSSWLGLGFQLPYRVIDVGVTYKDPSTGMATMSAQAGIHARDEQLSGIGDAQVFAHFARESWGFRFHARTGLTLPIGSTLDQDPFVLGNIGQVHQHVQFGTGTFLPYAVVEVQRPLFDNRATATAWGLAYLSLYDNPIGFRAGSRFSTGVNASSSLGTRWMTLAATLELHTETAETWQGIVHEDEGNAGRQDLYTGGSIALRPTDNLAIILDVKIPIYSHVNGSQLDYRGLFGLGVITTWDLRTTATYRGLDHGVAGPPGTTPELAPLPGKLVVYDLWAGWCPPCRELDGKLEALVARYPDVLAIRKLDVVDADSPAWKRYLEPGAFELPHVKVVKPDGTLALEATASPDELVAQLEALAKSFAK